MIATINKEVPTGRSMKIRDGFMSRARLLVGLSRAAWSAAAIGLTAALWSVALSRLLARLATRGLPVRRCSSDRRPGGRARPATRSADLGAVAQTVGAVDHHLIAGLQPAQDLLLLAVAGAELDDTDGNGVVRLGDIDEGAGLATLDGGDRHHDRILHRVDQQADVDELVGEQGLVLVVEGGAQLHRAGGDVDDVVVRVEPADRELGLLGAIEDARFERGAGL